MSDIDEDSTMRSSPSENDELETLPSAGRAAQEAPTTPARLSNFAAQAPSSELSPPSSQHGPSQPSNLASLVRDSAIDGANGSSNSMALNANGKRVMVDSKLEQSASKSGKPLGQSSSGYSWTRAEDEPGYAWGNRKAQEEYMRAMESILDKDLMIGNRYGDVCERGG